MLLTNRTLTHLYKEACIFQVMYILTSYLFKIFMEPPVLIRVGVIVGVRTNHNNVNAGCIKRVVKVGVREAFSVRHKPSGIVCFKAYVFFNDPGRLDLVVSLGDHPWAGARQVLQETAKRVP